MASQSDDDLDSAHSFGKLEGHDYNPMEKLEEVYREEVLAGAMAPGFIPDKVTPRVPLFSIFGGNSLGTAAPKDKKQFPNYSMFRSHNLISFFRSQNESLTKNLQSKRQS
jgi:hypothetical protein